MSTKHTPGPWRTHEHTDGTFGIVAANNTSPAKVWDHDNADANARLIAAAPEMASALQDAPTPPFMHFSEDRMRAWIDHYTDWFHARCAALAKAKGEGEQP